jgi:ABC-type oligopeptide transport system ATPase subunit
MRRFFMPIVELSHIGKSFGRVRAVDEVSFTVEPGEIFGLLGPNGAGKTTTIRVLLDIFKPERGTVSVFGDPLVLTRPGCSSPGRRASSAPIPCWLSGRSIGGACLRIGGLREALIYGHAR